MSVKKALLLTVGTGDITRQEESLIKPLMMSIKKGDFDSIILLPSQETNVTAEDIKSRLENLPIIINSLPEKGSENNPDTCFAFFDGIIRNLINEGFSQTNIVIDFTRGTKTMSAALVFAALRHEILSMRYISGERDERGQVKSGTEQIGQFHAAHAFFLSRLDQAAQLFKHGQFAAVERILPDENSPFFSLIPENIKPAISYSVQLAKFYSAWDRLSYNDAVNKYPPILPNELYSILEYRATKNMLDWVKKLASLDITDNQTKLPTKEECKDKAYKILPIAFDLWSNGMRRAEQGQYEDSVIRWYRILELVCQIKLFYYGYDTSMLNPEDENIIKLEKKLEGKKSSPLSTNKEGLKMASRLQATRLLGVLGEDEFANKLRDLAENGLVKETQRNNSLLIHGFKAMGPKDQKLLETQYSKLKDLLCKISDDLNVVSKDILEVSQSISFS